MNARARLAVGALSGRGATSYRKRFEDQEGRCRVKMWFGRCPARKNPEVDFSLFSSPETYQTCKRQHTVVFSYDRMRTVQTRRCAARNPRPTFRIYRTFPHFWSVAPCRNSLHFVFSLRSHSLSQPFTFLERGFTKGSDDR